MKEYMGLEKRLLQEIDVASVAGEFSDVKLLKGFLGYTEYRLGSRVKEHIV